MALVHWDLAATLWVNGFAGRSSMWDMIGVFGASLLIVFLVVAAVIAIVWRDGTARALLVAEIVGVVAAAWMISQLIGVAAFRERPFVRQPVRQLVAKDVREKSFPSDHATLAFAFAIPVAAAVRRRGVRAVLLATATIVAVSRVFVGVHYISDVLAGFLLALIVWWGIHSALNKKYASLGATT
ncbi:MAG: phosphatase PAP2 family protein [bacterium]|nr:phosphatase PAP2 family protein [bacterium]